MVDSRRDSASIGPYATIEPRLIALLNEPASESFSSYARLDLPPLHRQNASNVQPRPQGLGSGKKSSTGRALGGSSPQSLRKILDDDPEDSHSLRPKKRQRAETNKEDFVQLPQLPKKLLKAAKQVVPPIIIGLFDPPEAPPNAALFPPIASSSFHDSHGRNSLNTALPNVPKEDVIVKPSSQNESPTEEPKIVPKKRGGKTVRFRNRWSEEETQQMLLGVSKHGVGNWTNILRDPEFSFNGRKAVDIKDRFRTCCPPELNGKASRDVLNVDTTESSGLTSITRQDLSTTGDGFGSDEHLKSLKSRFMLGSSSDDSSMDELDTPVPDEPHQKPLRAHRKKLEDLLKIGIKEPFKKSTRRERRPYSDEEDRNILTGFHIHGFIWSAITKDPSLNLQSRRPTDIRDRMRNRYPKEYRNADEARRGVIETSSNLASAALPTPRPDLSVQASETPSSSQERERNILPSNHQTSFDAKSLPRLPFQTHYSFFAGGESFTDLLSQPLEWTDSIPFPSNLGGEMDISWGSMSSALDKQKQSFTEISSICASTLPPVPQYDPIYDTTGMSWDPSQHIGVPLTSKRDFLN